MRLAIQLAIIGLTFFMLINASALLVLAERKIMGFMQQRYGPYLVGPHGVLQPLADILKLLFKEDMTVKAADKVVYIVAPLIAVFCSLLTFAVIPLGPSVNMFGVETPLQLTDFPVAVLYILACASVGVYGIVLGGWSSNSTYPLLGAVRSTAQVISYELAMGLSLVSVFILAGSMSTSEIVGSQSTLWWMIPLAPAFVIYVISMVGETEQGLRAKGVAHTVGRWRYDANPRGMLMAEHWGLLKLLFSLPDEKLLGVHVIGDNACELIAAGLVAMTLGATCSTFIDACFNYPSLSDLYKYAAYDAMGRIDRGDVYRPWAPARPPVYPQKIFPGNSAHTT